MKQLWQVSYTFVLPYTFVLCSFSRTSDHLPRESTGVCTDWTVVLAGLPLWRPEWQWRAVVPQRDRNRHQWQLEFCFGLKENGKGNCRLYETVVIKVNVQRWHVSVGREELLVSTFKKFGVPLFRNYFSFAIKITKTARGRTQDRVLTIFDPFGWSWLFQEDGGSGLTFVSNLTKNLVENADEGTYECRPKNGGSGSGYATTVIVVTGSSLVHSLLEVQRILYFWHLFAVLLYAVFVKWFWSDSSCCCYKYATGSQSPLWKQCYHRADSERKATYRWTSPCQNGLDICWIIWFAQIYNINVLALCKLRKRILIYFSRTSRAQSCQERHRTRFL